MSSIEILHGWTEDNLNLQGIHWKSNLKDTCIVCIHGMSGNIIENYFAEILGEEFSKNNYGFIYGHNRGYNHINDIKTSKISKNGSNETKRIGVTYERFEESIFDIDLWVKKANDLGYKKIILMGHSLGCNKVIHYLSKNKCKGVFKVILASAPDMIGLVKLEKYQPNYIEMLNEAKNNISNNNPRKILSSILWDWYYLSSQTFLDLFEDDCPADNLPLLRSPNKFNELSNINIPIFAFLGEHDDIVINSLNEDLEQIKNKAINCPNFESSILKGANHVYGNKEKELSQLLLKWLSKT
jgi:alpha-beta hydrolase superfamily lysophospholipase